MIGRAVGAVLRFLLDIGDDRAIRIEKIEEEDLDIEDFTEDLGDGCYKIDYEKFEQAINDKIYDLTKNTAPKCSRCKKVLPPPEFSWHGRLYCRECLLKYEVIRSEMDPDIKRYRLPIALVFLEDGSRFPILWNFRRDTLDEWRFAKRRGRDVELYDPAGSKIIVDADLIVKFKVPHDCHTEIWTKSLDEFAQGR
ncbi:LIM domain-containing protein [Thermoactinomyces vulgaris]|jgi:hypothetical protein|uniref:hypothetical protein n=1 Tax=Thermoactinomyces vulgaris TaxID=2026 RepID=UPI003634E12B